MSQPWAMRIPEQHAGAIGQLRLLPEIQVGCEPGTCWLKGPDLSKKILKQLQQLPAGELYELLPDWQLRLHRDQVPTAMLPRLNWQPIQEYVTPALPSASFAGRLHEKLNLQLVRGSVEAEPNVLQLPFPAFAGWCEDAPEIRLHQLRFAVRHDGTTLVRGIPLPPLTGDRFVETDGIALPVGFTIAPTVSTDLLAEIYELATGDLCLWSLDGQVQKLEAKLFAVCTRSAVRDTRSALEAPLP